MVLFLRVRMRPLNQKGLLLMSHAKKESERFTLNHWVHDKSLHTKLSMASLAFTQVLLVNLLCEFTRRLRVKAYVSKRIGRMATHVPGAKFLSLLFIH